jgi:hypothetical protein
MSILLVTERFKNWYLASSTFRDVWAKVIAAAGGDSGLLTVNKITTLIANGDADLETQIESWGTLDELIAAMKKEALTAQKLMLDNSTVTTDPKSLANLHLLMTKVAIVASYNHVRSADAGWSRYNATHKRVHVGIVANPWLVKQLEDNEELFGSALFRRMVDIDDNRAVEVVSKGEIIQDVFTYAEILDFYTNVCDTWRDFLSTGRSATPVITTDAEELGMLDFGTSPIGAPVVSDDFYFYIDGLTGPVTINFVPKTSLPLGAHSTPGDFNLDQRGDGNYGNEKVFFGGVSATGQDAEDFFKMRAAPSAPGLNVVDLKIAMSGFATAKLVEMRIQAAE